MARDIEVRILSDAAQLERTVSKSSSLLARFGGDAEKAAQAQVAAGVKQRDSLEQLVAAYQHVADSAVKGSEEQVVAAQKAADAQRLLGAQVKTTAAESGTAFKGATSSALGFAKQAAFFGAGFLGFEGLKASIDTVLSAQESLDKLNQTLRDAHASVEALTPILDRYQASAAKAGFEIEDTRAAQTELVTAFGATKHALDELRAAEDLARAKNEALATAAQQLILLQEGNTRAAKQFGLVLPDLTSKQWQHKAAVDGITISQERGKVLYDELLPRIKHQNQAFADSPQGKIAEFHAEIQRLELAIGKGLLPAVDHYLTEIDDWLAKSKHQKEVTHDVFVAVEDLAKALDVAYKAGRYFEQYVLAPIVEADEQIARTIDGWKRDLDGLIGDKQHGLTGATTIGSSLLRLLQTLAKIGDIKVDVDLIWKLVSGGGGGGLLHDLEKLNALTPSGLVANLVADALGGNGHHNKKQQQAGHDAVGGGVGAGRGLTGTAQKIVAEALAYGPGSGCNPRPFPSLIPTESKPEPVKVPAHA